MRLRFWQRCRDGWHVWVFFDEPQRVGTDRRGRMVWVQARCKHCGLLEAKP